MMKAIAKCVFFLFPALVTKAVIAFALYSLRFECVNEKTTKHEPKSKRCIVAHL